MWSVSDRERAVDMFADLDPALGIRHPILAGFYLEPELAERHGVIVLNHPTVFDTEDGIYMETNLSWSIDDKRYNFQFGTEMGYEIKNGKMGKMLRNCTYTGITPEFWNSCDAIGNEDGWVMWGTPNCGKGEPLQIAHTGHGASPARFRDIRVGVMK